MESTEQPATAPSSPEVRFGHAVEALDRATRFVERPVRRASGTDRLNPLPHAGTISVFLLIVVVVSGLYITLFFEFGHAASYDSVARMEEHAIQKVVRAVHRYASAALVLTTLVHGWRIATAQRFTSRRRRHRWITGVASLTLVWLAGVTGYWLVWDRRAAALNEALAGLLRPFGAGRRFAVDRLLGVSAGSGSGTLLVLWLLHLALTAVLGWFVYRHLRRSKLPWLPPPLWMGVMGGALVVVSVVAPLGMLEPARPDLQVTSMPVDPFVLFLLPPLLGDWRWVAAGVMVLGPAAVAAVPRLVRGRDLAPVVVDADACTGCELCMLDCPYDALTMTHGDRAIAVVDTSACTSCGICLGSCAFGALSLPDTPPVVPPIRVADREALLVCDRHDRRELDAGDAAVVPVRCAGVVPADATRTFLDAGATSVQLIGCAPSECRYGIGNRLARERVDGDRAPRVPRRFAGQVAVASVHPDDLARREAWDAPDDSPDASPDAGSRRIARAGALVLVSVLAVVAATRTPFGDDAPDPQIRVVVDHADGAELDTVGVRAPTFDEVEVLVDGVPVAVDSLPTSAGRTVGWLDAPLGASPARVQVRAWAGRETLVVFDDDVDIDAGTRLVVTAFDTPPDPGRDDGRAVFNSRAAGCTVCHSLERGDDGVGPTLYGVATVAADRLPGLDAENYLRQSILLPDQYVVDGWPAGQMLPIYRERLTDRDLEALITYLLTLTENPS